LYLHTEKQRVNIEKQHLHQTVQTRYKKKHETFVLKHSNIKQTSKISARTKEPAEKVLKSCNYEHTR